MEPKVPKKEPLKGDTRERPASDTHLYENAISTGRRATLATSIDEDESGYVTSTFGHPTPMTKNTKPDGAAISTGRRATLATGIDEDESGYVTSTFRSPTPMTKDTKPTGAAISTGRRATLATAIDEDESGYVTSTFRSPTPMTKDTKPTGAGPRRHTSTSALKDGDPGYLTPMKKQEGPEEVLYENTKRLRETTEIAGKEKKHAPSKTKDDSGELGEGLYESTSIRGDNRRDQGNDFNTRGKTMTLGRLKDHSGPDSRWGQSLPPPREVCAMGIGENSNVPYEKVDSLQHRRQEHAIVQLTEKLESSHTNFKKLLIFIIVVIFLFFAAIAAGLCMLIMRDPSQGDTDCNQTKLQSGLDAIKYQVSVNKNFTADYNEKFDTKLDQMEQFFENFTSDIKRSFKEHKEVEELEKNITERDMLNKTSDKCLNALKEVGTVIGGSLYIIPTEGRKYSQANSSCIAMGGELAYSVLKNETHRREFADTIKPLGCWIGLYKYEVTDKWKWSNGAVLNETLSSISPDDGVGCALVFTNTSIQAVPCDSIHCYICEMQL